MDISLKVTIKKEIQDCVELHLSELSEYGVTASLSYGSHIDEISNQISELFQLTQSESSQESETAFHEAVQRLKSIDTFLQLFNLRQILLSGNIATGQTYLQIQQWLDQAKRQYGLSTHKVWDIISPAQPDTLKEIGDNLYEALWWQPIPMMDIEILKLTPRVNIVREPYDSMKAVGSIGVQFTICQWEE